MKKRNFEEKVIVNEGRYSRTIIHFLYKLMLFRQFNNFSPHDVSYLLGKKSNYFEEIEQFKSLPKRLNDIVSQVSMLGNIHPINLFSVDPYGEQEYNRYRMTKIIRKDCILSKLEILENGGTEILLFALTDIIPFSDHFFRMEEKDRTQLKNAIQQMIESGYFSEKREPYILYRKCKRDYDLHIRPEVLEQTMQSFTKENNSSLKMKYDKEDSYCFRYYYIIEDNC